MYDTITPEQWVVGLTVSILFFCGLVWALWHYFPARDISSEEAPDHTRSSVRYAAEITGSNPEPEPPNLPNPASESRTDDRTGAFALDDAERLAVTKMIYHKASDPKATKASAVYVGFGVKKGDSAAYRRASAIYDALFVLPEPDKYPLMTDEQRAAREELGLVIR